MPSKYYNPTLATRVAQAKSSGFLDAGKIFQEAYDTVQEKTAPFAMAAMKEYEDDVKKIYDVNFDQNGIAAHQLSDLKEFVKQQKEIAFQARQQGAMAGKEALGETLLNVKGAANIAKQHGAVAQEIQQFLSDPDRVSSANDNDMLPSLMAIANAKIDYADPNGQFYVLGDGKTKLSMGDIQRNLDQLIEVPDEAYLGLYDRSQNLVKEKYDDFGNKYYAFDELNSAQMRTIVFDTIDEHGKDFVYDAMSNKNAYRGVTVSAFINDDLASKIGQTYGYAKINPAINLDLQGKTKSQIDRIVASKFGINLETPEGKADVFRIHKELVSAGYTEALKKQYPDRAPKFKEEKKTGTGAPTNERYVAQVANRIKKAIEKEQGTMNESTFIKIANETLSPSAKREGKLFTDRNDGKTIYVQNALLQQNQLGLKESEKKSKADFEKEFEDLYPPSIGNIFLNGNPLEINLSDRRAIGEEILGQSGVSDYEKFISKYLPPFRVPEIERAAVKLP